MEPFDAGQRAPTVRILAIDQGTSATKAVVFGEDGEILTSVESAVTPRAVAGGGVEQDPEQLWDSVCEAGRAAIAGVAGGVEAVGFANQGETVLGLGPRHGPFVEHGHLLAGSARRQRLCRVGGRRRVADTDDRASTRSVLRGAEDGVAAAQRHHRGRGVDERRLVGAPPHRRVRHRRHDRLPDVAARPGTAHVVGRGLRRVRIPRCGPPGRRRHRGGDRPHRCLRPVVAADRVERRPAGRPGRGALPGTRRVEVHLRHGCLSAGQRRPAGNHVLRRPGRLGGLAARRRGRVLHRRAGLCRRRSRRLAAALGFRPPGRGSRRRRRSRCPTAAASPSSLP